MYQLEVDHLTNPSYSPPHIIVFLFLYANSVDQPILVSAIRKICEKVYKDQPNKEKEPEKAKEVEKEKEKEVEKEKEKEEEEQPQQTEPTQQQQ